MAQVDFTVVRSIPLPAREVFDELTDWAGHAEWVPMTRVEILAGEGGPGTEFIATTGLGPAALPDRMRVDSLDPDTMTVVITKIGPVLTGEVHLCVVRRERGRADLSGSRGSGCGTRRSSCPVRSPLPPAADSSRRSPGW